MTNEAQLVSGLLLEHVVDFVKMQKHETGIGDLEKHYGELLFDEHRMYPLNKLTDLQEKALKVVFGEITDQGYFELGESAFNTFAKTLVGATLTNVADTPEKMLQKIQEMWGAVVNFGNRKVISIDEKIKTAEVQITGDPRNPHYFCGVISAGLKSIGVKSEMSVIEREEMSCKLAVHWG